MRAGRVAALLTALYLIAPRGYQAAHGSAAELWREVEVIRTTHGVPHIRAANLRAAGYALAWVQCEDYGTRTPIGVRRASVQSRGPVSSVGSSA